jgi:hypothetical protein
MSGHQNNTTASSFVDAQESAEQRARRIGTPPALVVHEPRNHFELRWRQKMTTNEFPLAVTIQQALAPSFRPLVRLERRPTTPADGVDIAGVTALTVVQAAVCGERIAAAFGGDRDARGLARTVGGLAGLALAVWLLAQGWRLRQTGNVG